MKSPDEDYWLRIPQIIAPDLRYREIARRLVYYTDEDLDHKYNQFTSVLQLLLFCQRDTTLEEMFSDVRNGDLSLNEIRGLLTERYENPYIGLSADKSIGLEVQVITERLRKSKFQTRDGLEYAETEMKNLVVEMKEAAAEKKKRAVEEQKKKEKQAQEEARLAQELIEQRALELERATKEAQRPRRYRCDGFKECTVKRSPNPNAVHIPGLSRVDIPYRHHDTSGFKEVKVHKVPELKKIKPPEPPKEHWTASMSSVRPAPQKSSGELLAQVKEIMAQCDTFAEEPQEEMSPLQQHALQKINEEEESPIDSSLLELEEQLREKLRETAGPSEPPPKGNPVKEKLKTS
uniref:WSD domain-containing protein n=1 Tax=Caenorhabditis tropicalis TaxID=1561998 RepID=A0A1I7TVV7_9PELO